MKYLFIVLSIFLFSCSSLQKPNISEVKTEILGGLVLGESISYNLALMETQKQQKKIRSVEPNVLFYMLEDSNHPTHSQYLIFPNLQHSDSIITRVEYYAYSLNRTWHIALANPELMENNGVFGVDDYITQKNLEDEWTNNLLTKFSLQSNRDSETGISYPTIAGKDDLRNKIVFKFLDKQIQAKYGKEISDTVVGETTKLEPYFKHIKIWETDLLKITLTMQRLDDDNYITAVIYEFNAATWKKYGLTKLSNKVNF